LSVARETLAREIRLLEEKLLSREVRASVSELDRLLADDFVEIGSSGRMYSKTEIVRALLADPNPPGEPRLEDFRLVTVTPDVALATYRYAKSLRSSLWRKEERGWRMLFHQGTPATDAA
jgi:hypothetical protein